LGSGYVGQAFTRELGKRFINYTSLSRAKFDYTKFDNLWLYIKEHRPKFVINCAGVTGVPNIDWCEDHKAETLLANVALPLTVAHACAAHSVTWAQLSSGCLYNGNAGDGCGFTEKQPPDFSFRFPQHSFYSASKALAEEAIAGIGRRYVWRIRLPFNEVPNPKNLISKLLAYERVYDSPPNSASHLDDAVSACIDLWESDAAYGVYNVVNPGVLRNRRIVELIQNILKPKREFEFWKDDAEFYAKAAKAPRSNCVLSSEKLLTAGVKMRSVIEALTDSLDRWKAIG